MKVALLVLNEYGKIVIDHIAQHKYEFNKIIVCPFEYRIPDHALTSVNHFEHWYEQNKELPFKVYVREFGTRELFVGFVARDLLLTLVS